MNRVYIVTQNGMPYRVFSDFDFAGDEYIRLNKQYPGFKWAVVSSLVDHTVCKVRSSI